MQPHVGHPSLSANTPPCFVDINKVLSIFTTGKDKGITFLARELSKQGECRGGERQMVGSAVLRVLNREFFAIPVDIGPTGFQ